MSRHDSPSGYYTDQNTTYRRYTNRGQHASGQGVINNISMYNPSNPLEELEKHCSPSAAFDSAARFDPPRCAESTRLWIIQNLEEWIGSDGDTTMSPSVFWLYGGAGAGKSALAQSLSEKFQGKNQLAASFFFFRSDPTRNNGKPLIPTLVSHLVNSFEGFGPLVEDRIRQNRGLFTKNYQFQIRELLIEPLLVLNSTGGAFNHPRLIVIDGLDECENTDVQCELLRVIARAIPQIPYPLRFLVTSRPEAHITHVFDHDRDLQAIPVHRYNLSYDPHAYMDIYKFLENEFVEIRRVHPLRRYLPDAWPGYSVITSLVERSSRHFIYASTVIRYIRSPKHRPDDRLEVVLRLRPPQGGDLPYFQLDALYTLIFAAVGDHNQLEKICLFLGILYLQSKNVGYFASVLDRVFIMEGLLEMKAGDLVLLLDPILSLVAIDGDKVRILHKSLFDYLLDAARGGHLPLDLARVHELAANYILQQNIVEDMCDRYHFQDFSYHCQYSYLNNILKDYLNSLEVPYRKSAMTFLPSDVGANRSLQSIVWYFFRTLSRHDFDPSGQAYERYMVKWTDYLQSPVPAHASPLSQEVHDLKRELDALLTKWNPPNFNPMDVGMDPVGRVDHIKQEHIVFSAYAKAYFSDDTNTIVSSLVLRDHFIHSYDLEVWDDWSILTLRTYSRHDNTCCVSTIKASDHTGQKTLDYLKTIGKYLFSDLYQKYGVELDEGIVDAYKTTVITVRPKRWEKLKN